MLSDQIKSNTNRSNLVWYKENNHQLLKDFAHYSGVSTGYFEQVNTGRITSSFTINHLAQL